MIAANIGTAVSDARPPMAAVTATSSGETRRPATTSERSDVVAPSSHARYFLARDVLDTAAMMKRIR